MEHIPNYKSKILFKDTKGEVHCGVFDGEYFSEPDGGQWLPEGVVGWVYIQDAYDSFALQLARRGNALDSPAPSATFTSTAGSGGYATVEEEPEVLLPCPLCGEEVIPFYKDSPDGTIKWLTIHHGPTSPCGISFLSKEKDAITKWNTRH